MVAALKQGVTLRALLSMLLIVVVALLVTDDGSNEAMFTGYVAIALITVLSTHYNALGMQHRYDEIISRIPDLIGLHNIAAQIDDTEKRMKLLEARFIESVKGVTEATNEGFRQSLAMIGKAVEDAEEQLISSMVGHTSRLGELARDSLDAIRESAAGAHTWLDVADNDIGKAVSNAKGTLTRHKNELKGELRADVKNMISDNK